MAVCEGGEPWLPEHNRETAPPTGSPDPKHQPPTAMQNVQRNIDKIKLIAQ